MPLNVAFTEENSLLPDRKKAMMVKAEVSFSFSMQNTFRPNVVTPVCFFNIYILTNMGKIYSKLLNRQY